MKDLENIWTEPRPRFPCQTSLLHFHLVSFSSDLLSLFPLFLSLFPLTFVFSPSHLPVIQRWTEWSWTLNYADLIHATKGALQQCQHILIPILSQCLHLVRRPLRCFLNVNITCYLLDCKAGFTSMFQASTVSLLIHFESLMSCWALS